MNVLVINGVNLNLLGTQHRLDYHQRGRVYSHQRGDS